MNDTLTNPQKILLAARQLDAAQKSPFTIEALSVAAWKLDARTFGLRGFTDIYPNANVIYSSIFGERGLIKRGWLDQVEPKIYTLSKQGRAEADRISNGHAERRPLGPIQPSKEVEAELQRLLVSKAVLRMRSGQGETLNRTDAFAFLGDHDPDHVEQTIALARECVVAGVVRLRSGREVGERELAEVSRVNNWLAAKFARDLERARKAVPA